MKERIISLKELSNFGLTKNLNEQAKSLAVQQKITWKALAKNHEALDHLQTRTFYFDQFKIIAQYNPGRIRSSAAKTDAKSIAERPCFLCTKNLPPKQKGIVFQYNYLLLTNPYPVFSEHLTISELKHTPQQIMPHFTDLLTLNQNLPDFTVFYNGPKCGASAPDHFHFQAGTKGTMPVEQEFATLIKQSSEVLFQNEELKIVAVKNYLRHFIAIISRDKTKILQEFKLLCRALGNSTNEEPMMNILCNYENGTWRVIIFLRDKQRSSHFYHNDDSRILVSPAAAELGGILILPEKKDFEKITKKEIEEIYGEVTINADSFIKLKENLKTLKR